MRACASLHSVRMCTWRLSSEAQVSLQYAQRNGPAAAARDAAAEGEGEGARWLGVERTAAAAAGLGWFDAADAETEEAEDDAAAPRRARGTARCMYSSTSLSSSLSIRPRRCWARAAAA